MKTCARLAALTVLLLASPVFAQPTPTTDAPAEPPPPAPVVPPETRPAPEPPHVVAPPPVPEPEKKPEPAPPPPAHAKYDLSFYGFVELDSIYDTTQGLNDLAGNAAIARSGSFAANHGSLIFGARNSRIGMKLAAPVYEDIKANAQLEMDFLGNQPPGISEAAFWQNPTFRFRHFNLKLETKPFDILIGQYWQLFGWQSLFHPNTVDIQGVPGQIYSRAPQIRVGKLIKGDTVDIEVAAAAARPPQRASSTPDGQAGIKVMMPKLKAWHTAGSTGSALDSAALGVSFVGRRFAVADFSKAPSSAIHRNGYGVSVDALIPIVPATKDSKKNATTFTGSFVYGAGIADLYSSLSGGTSNPPLPNPADTYPSNIDNGLALYFIDGATGTASLHPIQWTSVIAGVQYYLPPTGRAWVSANYSHMSSANAHLFGDPKKVWDASNWVNANVMYDVTPAVRLGLGFDWIHQTYVDLVEGTDYRVQGSAFFIF